MRRTTWLLLAIASALTARALADDPSPKDDEARRAKVFATVGSETITVGELDDLVAARSPYARKRLLERDALKELAEAQVQNELYYQGAEKLGYGDDPDVQRFVEQVLVKAYVREEFQEAVGPDEITDERLLANQVHRLQVELTDTMAELDSYKVLTMELHDRLVAMKEGCERKEKQMLQALLHWMSTQLKQRV